MCAGKRMGCFVVNNARRRIGAGERVSVLAVSLPWVTGHLAPRVEPRHQP